MHLHAQFRSPTFSVQCDLDRNNPAQINQHLNFNKIASASEIGRVNETQVCEYQPRFLPSIGIVTVLRTSSNSVEIGAT
jgi:hypothetical protein